MSGYGTVTALSRSSTIDAQRQFRYLAFLGMLPTKIPVPASWAEHIHTYLLTEISAGRPLTTVKLRRSHLAHMARGLRCSPQNVTTEKLNAWFGQQVWKRETRRSYRSTVRSFYGFLFKAGVVEVDPTIDLPRIRPESPVARPAPDSAWHFALATADARVTIMLRLAAEAGLRRAEVAKVNVVDLRDGPRLLVHGKGSRDRVIPITDDLASVIARGAQGHTPGMSPSGWLFPGHDDGHLTPGWVGMLCARALPDSLTMHTLRHRFATRAYRATRNLRAVQILLGHASIVTTQRYLAVDDSEIRDAMLGAAA